MSERAVEEGRVRAGDVVHFPVGDLAVVRGEHARPRRVDGFDLSVLAWNAAHVWRPFGFHPARHCHVLVVDLLRHDRLGRLLEERTVDHSKLGHQRRERDDVEVPPRGDDRVEAVRVGVVPVEGAQRAAPHGPPPPRDGQALRDERDQPQVLELVGDVDEHVGLDGEASEWPVLHPLLVGRSEEGDGGRCGDQHEDEARESDPRKLLAEPGLPVDAVLCVIAIVELRSLDIGRFLVGV